MNFIWNCIESIFIFSNSNDDNRAKRETINVIFEEYPGAKL